MITDTLQPTDTAGLRQLYMQHCKRYGFARRQQDRYETGLNIFLKWLDPQPGRSWQELWESRFEASDDWQEFTAPLSFDTRSCLHKILQILVAYRHVRPSYRWLLNHR